MFKKVILFCILLGALIFPFSCANTSTPPSGGQKDTLAPILVKTHPQYGATNFSGKKIELTFNEFPKLIDADKQIILSPPQKKRPQTMVRGKSIIVTFPAALDYPASYSLQFGASIVDNNEDNPYGNYSLSFSTGPELDSLLTSGYVVDAKTLAPLEGISIVAHTNSADTSVYKNLPRALGKSDHWGYFTLLNLRHVPYHIFAIEDQSRNHKYDPESDQIGFLDKEFYPHAIMTPDSFAMARVNIKDTLEMLSRPVELVMYVFKEPEIKQLLRGKERTGTHLLDLIFSAPDAKIISMQLQGIDSSLIIQERSFHGDSLRLWINKLRVPDTLKGHLSYLKTDSLGMLVPAKDSFKLAAPKTAATPPAKKGEKVDRRDLLKLTIEAKGETLEEQGIVFRFAAYPIELKTEQMLLTYTTARKEKIKVPYSLKKDSLDGCRYYLKAEKWIPGMSYELDVPQHIFKDIRGFTNDSLSQKASLPEAGKTGMIELALSKSEGNYIIELLSEKKDRVVRSRRTSAGEKVTFPYLPDGKYVLRFTEDRNNNGVWDTGSLAQKKQAERVRIFHFANGVETIEIKDKRELLQNIDIDELFHHEISPSIPDKKK